MKNQELAGNTLRNFHQKFKKNKNWKSEHYVIYKDFPII